MTATPISGEGLATCQLRVADPDVVLVRCLLEAYEGLGQLYGDGSGVVQLAAPVARAPELERFVDVLVQGGLARRV